MSPRKREEPWTPNIPRPPEHGKELSRRLQCKADGESLMPWLVLRGEGVFVSPSFLPSSSPFPERHDDDVDGVGDDDGEKKKFK
jgi:hypothetical protein